MPIQFTCNCGKRVQVGDETAGQEGTCPSCGRTVIIPAKDGQFVAEAHLPKHGTAVQPWNVSTIEPLPEPEEDIGRLVSHAGVPINENDDYFSPAPLEIGRLYSGFTTLKRHQGPLAGAMRALIAFVFLVVGVVFTLGVGVVVFGNAMPLSQPIIWAAAVLVGGLLAWVAALWTRFRHSCSYVGDRGIALFRCAGDRDRIVRSEVFYFEDAVELRIGQTRHYYNGVYTGTQYSFTWTDELGQVVHRLSGTYKSEDGNPHAADPYHYAVMAENAWTMYLFRDIDRITKSKERLYFGLTGGDYVQLGQDLFILAQGGKKFKLHADEIEKMTVGNGVVSIWEVGAKEGWFVNKGIHQFMYHDLGNARFFLFALERLLGIRF